MPRLWEFDENGEPWLENGAPLLIVNRPKKKGKTMARSKYARRKSRSGRKAAPRRARRRTTKRRNPWPMAGIVAAANPRRKRRGPGRKAAPRRKSRKKGYRRNPALMGISLPPLQSVIYAGVGFIGVPMMEGFLTRMLPVSLTSSVVGKYATRIASVLGLSYLTKMVIGSSESKMVAIGGGAYVLTSAITEFAPGMIPGMGAYRPATLSAYAGSTGRTFNQLGAPDFGAINTARSAPFGGSKIVATRFRRFQ